MGERHRDRDSAGADHVHPLSWLYYNLLAPVAAAGLRYRLTESNDYLLGVAGASDAFAWRCGHSITCTGGQLTAPRA